MRQVARVDASSARRDRGVLISLLGGLLLVSIDIAIVNVAAPSIRDDLRASGGQLELIVSGYVLTYAVLLITCARLGDLRGRRPMYLVGLAVFTASSLACGLAPTAAVLIGARLVQGAAAALMAAQVLSGIQRGFTGPARARALGWYAAVLSGGAVVGQAVGGVLVSADVAGTGWRPIFLVNVPIGVVLLLAAWWSLPRRPADAERRLDLPGVAALSLALTVLVVPLVLGREYGWPAWAWAGLALSLPALGVFVLVERSVAARHGAPLVATELLRRRPIACALASLAAGSATYFALLFVLALHLQQGLGRSPAYSGLILVPWVAAFGVAGPVLGRLGARTRHRAAAVGGLVLAAGFGGLAASPATDGAGGTPVLAILLAVGGLGWGAAFSGTLAQLTDVVSAEHAADISGLFQTTLRIGGAVGVAVFGSLYLELAGPSPDASTGAFVVTASALALTALLAAAFGFGATTVVLRARPAARTGARRTAPDSRSARARD